MIKECMSGYFQFSSKEDGLYITVYPPKSGYGAASIDDVMFYVDNKNISCDSVKLMEAVKAGSEAETTVKVSEESQLECSEFADYRISSDCMRVEACFYPPFENGGMLDKDEIIRDLQHIGVTYGVDEEVIDSFLKDRHYGKAYTVAKGTEPVSGREGYVEYKFNTELKPRPKMNEDGTVDFHTFENVNHVTKGDTVAVLHPEYVGEAGTDVLNRSVNPDKVKHVVFRFGRNLVISEDGKELITLVSGHVVLESDKVFVSNVLELVDVDNSTGDIDYNGDVSIKGNVLAGFTVKASGNVVVTGVVEGATVIAGGDITLNRGVQGMNKAVIKAGGKIVSKFIESVQLVEAGGNIEADSILHSKVVAKGVINANGKNGLIIGGDVKSTVMIQAKTIGNEMGTATVVGVGVDPTMKKRMDELKKGLSKMGDEKIQLAQLMTALRKKQDAEGTLSPEKQEMLSKTMRNLLVMDQQLAKEKKEYEDIRSCIGEEKNACIKVSNRAYVGTKLMFGDICMFLKEKYDYCQFRKEGAEIKSLPL